ncbi:acyl-CoA N-acyltransferase [Xylariaceae sp. FL1019]|nr:acyl-CoA N-acyltransferase [Xylariaceae sp. FL1019]
MASVGNTEIGAGDSVQPQSKPTTPITIGRASPSEALSIAEIGAHTFTANFGASVPEEDLAAFLNGTYSEASIKADLDDPKKDVLVARGLTDKVLGFVYLFRELSEPCIPGDPTTHAELGRLYVAMDAQGRGVGTKLCAALEGQARAEGFKELWLSVWEHAPQTQRLYERLGFGRVGELFFQMGVHKHRDLVYNKSL